VVLDEFEISQDKIQQDNIQQAQVVQDKTTRQAQDKLSPEMLTDADRC
jgi:hypothetical protein